MRRHFQTARLSSYFNTAWTCIPKTVQSDLRPFIRQVREVKKLAGTYIRCPDGTRYGPAHDGTGFTFFYSDDTIELCDIVFPRCLARFEKAATLCIMLHELAHAHDYYINRRKAMRQNIFHAEQKAWLKADEWARQAQLNPRLTKAIEMHSIYAILVDVVEEITAKLTDDKPDIKKRTRKLSNSTARKII